MKFLANLSHKFLNLNFTQKLSFISYITQILNRWDEQINPKVSPGG